MLSLLLKLLLAKLPALILRNYSVETELRIFGKTLERQHLIDLFFIRVESKKEERKYNKKKNLKFD